MAGPVAIIAGEGTLPVSIANVLLAAGREVLMVRLTGRTLGDASPWQEVSLPVGAFGALITTLRNAGCQDLVFAGYVGRPDFSTLALDDMGQTLLPDLLVAAQKGDDAILRQLIRFFEGEGFCVLGAEEAYPALLCPAGLLTPATPLTAQDRADLSRAVHITRLIGKEDIGQGAVVCRGLVLAIEAQEGTDAMLSRVAALPRAVRGGDDARAGLLVKCPKPGQDNRIDLPTIGVETVHRAAKAGLAGIGLAAGAGLILDRSEVLAAAKAVGLSIIGFDPSDEVP